MLTHHVKSGQFIRQKQGLYRIRQYPSTEHEGVVAAWLGVGRDTAVVSHESALQLLGLSDVVPRTVHLTVPRSRRRRRSPPGVTIHTTVAAPTPGEIVVRDGIKVTAPARSIADAAASGTAPEQIVAAVVEALERGLSTKTRLMVAAERRGSRVVRLVERGIRVAEAV